jgi:hypothetical protein
MANCDVCRNLQLDKFESIEASEYIRERLEIEQPTIIRIIISRSILINSADAGCETCGIIYGAWRATVTGLAEPMSYVCITQPVVGAPLCISGSMYGDSREIRLSRMGLIYALQGYTTIYSQYFSLIDAKYEADRKLQELGLALGSLLSP